MTSMRLHRTCRPMFPPILLLFAAACVRLAAAQGEWHTAQATWYDGVNNGYCGYGSGIPQYVAAWPRIGGGDQAPWQGGLGGDACGHCVDVRCVPGRWVENPSGSIYLDRTKDCKDPNQIITVKVVDECRCVNGNNDWCCNNNTPRLGIHEHIDLGRTAFGQLMDPGLGIMPIQWRSVPCGGQQTTNSGSGSPASTATTPAAAPAAPAQSTPASTFGGLFDTPAPAAPSSGGGAGSSQIARYEQCGGAGGKCQQFGMSACQDQPFSGYTCSGSDTCQRESQWHWQCMPGSSSSPTTTNPGPSTPPPSSQTPNPSPSTTGTSLRGIGSFFNSGFGQNNQVPASGTNSGSTSTNGNTQPSGCQTVIPKWQQCGGLGGNCASFGCVRGEFLGTCCGGGSTCQEQSPYYYQCL